MMTAANIISLLQNEAHRPPTQRRSIFIEAIRLLTYGPYYGPYKFSMGPSLQSIRTFFFFFFKLFYKIYGPYYRAHR